MKPNQTVMIHGPVFTLRFSYNEQRNHRNVEPRSLTTPKEHRGRSMGLHCPSRGFHHGPAPVCSAPPHHQPPHPSQFNTVLAGQGLLSPCTTEVETGTTARSLLLPLVGPAGQQTHVVPSQLCSQLSLMSPKPAGANSSPGLSSVGLGADAHPIWESQLCRDRQHPKARDRAGGPQRGTGLKTVAQLSFEYHKDPENYGWTHSVQIAARAHNTSSPIPKVQEPLCFLPAAQTGNTLHSHFLSCTP